MNEVKSPLTESTNVELIESISTDYLKKRYLNNFNIDISNIVNGIENIYKYKCLDSNYVFYYPYNISGDSNFYEQLEAFDWYYMPWKWEHQKSLEIINENSKVLEIGCAEGHFLQELVAKKSVDAYGVELNQKAVEIASKKKINVFLEDLETFSYKFEAQFDYVCSFQVLEHVSNVKSFVESMLRCLKKGGVLIIGVPNNDSYLGEIDSLLNQPPHHLGLWNKLSLKKLAEKFQLRKIKFYFEPLQNYQIKDFNSVINKLYIDKLEKNVLKYGFFGRIINAFNKVFYKKILKIKKANFESFTILAVFTK